MKRRNEGGRFGWIGLMLLVSPAFSQTGPDSVKVVSTALHNSIQFYYQVLGSEIGMNNGIAYRADIPRASDQGQPYFDSDRWMTGEIWYGGMRYDNVPLRYDVVRDKVVALLAPSGIKLELISENVKYFTINDHRFVQLIRTDRNSPIETGFFELLYDGSVKLYLKWKRNRNELTRSGELEIRYEDQNEIFLQKDDRYFIVYTKASVLQVFEDKKVMLQKFIKRNHLSFGKHRIESIKKIVAYYELDVE